MSDSYVQQRDGGYWISGTRVSLDSLVVAFQQGLSVETIVAECFPTLTLEQAYGAIAYYLAHRAEIDSHLKIADEEFEALRGATHRSAGKLSARLAEARRQTSLATSIIYSLPL